MPQLCLGTVQFGMEYGINNQIDRQPVWEESLEMLDYAVTHGIHTIDTASAYGEAEYILGEFFKTYKNKQPVKVISKLRPNVIEEGNSAEKTIIAECEASLSRLGLDQLDGYLLHTPEYIYQKDILNALQRLKQQGYAKHIGISIYDLKEGYAALETGVMDYIQLPYSILDQRGIKEGFIPKAKQAGAKVFTRSAFLQGLFMMKEDGIPAHLKQAVPYLKTMERILSRYQADTVSAILEFVMSQQEIDYLVFGVERKEQLEENICKATKRQVPRECMEELKSQIGSVEQSVIFPSLWAGGKKAQSIELKEKPV